SSRILDTDAQRIGNPALDGLHGTTLVEPLPAAEEVIRVQVAEDDGGIGNGGLGAALVVAGGTGHRAGAARSDLDLPELVDARDRAAAGADRVGRNDRQGDAPAVDHRVEIVDAGLAVKNHAEVEARAAHVG